MERIPVRRKLKLSTMISLLIRTSLALLLLNQLVTPADAWGSRNTYSNERGVYNSGHEYNNPKNLAGNDPGLPSQSAPRRGLGISAWGIVLVVVALILAGMGFYYFSICYDICQPTKSKYDKMGLPTMA